MTNFSADGSSIMDGRLPSARRSLV
jgi:hypothetical protein